MSDPHLPDILAYLEEMGLSSEDFAAMPEKDRTELLNITLESFPPEEIAAFRDRFVDESWHLAQEFHDLRIEITKKILESESTVIHGVKDSDPERELILLKKMEDGFAAEVSASHAEVEAENADNFENVVLIQPDENDFATKKTFEVICQADIPDTVEIVLGEAVKVDFGQGGDGELIVYAVQSADLRITARIYGWQGAADTGMNFSKADKIVVRGGKIDDFDIRTLLDFSTQKTLDPHPFSTAASVVFHDDAEDALYFVGKDKGLF
jgi:hypothetical protein